MNIGEAVDIVQPWLQKIAENTAVMKAAVERGGKGAGGTGAAAKDDAKQDSRFDRFAKRLEGTLATSVARALGTAGVLASRGLAGSVEGARLDYATEQLSRQLAAVMLPFTQAMTYLTTQLTTRMALMSGGEQNRLMGGLVGAGIGLRYGGLPGALAGGAVGSLMGGGPSGPYDSALGAGAGAYLGFRVAGPIGAAVGAGAGAIASSGDYGRLRGEGSSRFWAVLGSGIGALTDLGYGVFGPGGLGIGSGPNPMDAIRREADARAGRGAAPRRDVTPFSAEMGEAGSFYFRAQAGVTRATAGAGDEPGPFKPVVDVLLMIFDVLVMINGGVAPAPRAAAG